MGNCPISLGYDNSTHTTLDLATAGPYGPDSQIQVWF